MQTQVHDTGYPVSASVPWPTAPLSSPAPVPAGPSARDSNSAGAVPCTASSPARDVPRTASSPGQASCVPSGADSVPPQDSSAATRIAVPLDAAPARPRTGDSSASTPAAVPVTPPTQAVSTPSSTAPAPDLHHASSDAAPAVLPHRTRLQGGIQKPKEFTDNTVRYGNLAESSKPFNLLSTPHWKTAMMDEYSALIRNKT
jgi:hypothetical protein